MTGETWIMHCAVIVYFEKLCMAEAGSLRTGFWLNISINSSAVWVWLCDCRVRWMHVCKRRIEANAYDVLSFAPWIFVSLCIGRCHVFCFSFASVALTRSDRQTVDILQRNISRNQMEKTMFFCTITSTACVVDLLCVFHSRCCDTMGAHVAATMLTIHRLDWALNVLNDAIVVAFICIHRILREITSVAKARLRLA